ncbi:fused DSP-PTPase phosphatase/NAD kinase-like protein [Pseudoalteromonas denitrificans]|uniref:TIGR01244 family protein n=1 Tax=Pseudoalteromonas denitrificans DSM 6059 TaxID=1123010 RepID=A0A1I1TUQ2_9GAMM|nr:protein tyrosine phosphatase family protein [Pseudoalteromonas denitrificans]SFD59280.1 TIGR01244 family protein [Pseudoalteromonas denitrificans DSM 6059]
MTLFLKHKAMLILMFFLTFNAFAQTNDLSHLLSAKNTQKLTERFIVGGQPSLKDLSVLSENGVTTIINLRAQNEFIEFDEQAKTKALGMTYISIPIAGAVDLTTENVTKFSKIINQNNNKTFVHCASGNRVGAMFALDAYLNKRNTLDEAISIGKKAGLTRLETKVRAIIDKNK